jgi:hypothetical protein
MKNLTLAAGLMALCGSLLMSGCTKEEKTAGGVVIGAGSGALIGGLAGGGTGAAIGAVGGGVAGGLIGHSMGDDDDGK